MVVHGSIEVLSVAHMPNVIVFGALYVKVRDPSKLTIDVSIFGYVTIIWHSCSLDLIHLIWVMLSSWLQKNRLFRLELLIKVLSIVSMVLMIECRWSCMEAFVPLLIPRGKHAIVCVPLND